MSADRRTTRARLAEIFASRGFRRLFVTRTVSQVGDGIFQLAAADLLLFDNPGPNPAMTLTALSAVTLVPFSAISPFVGVFIDRWNRRTILGVTPIVRAVLAVVVALGVGRGEQGADFFLIVLAVLSANRFFLATMAASLPQLVPEDDLLVANSAASTGGSVANVAGLGIGAALSAVIGGTEAAGVAAIAFAAAAVLARGIPVTAGLRLERVPLAEEVHRVTGEMVEGLRRLRQSRRAAYALSAVSVNQALVGAMTAAVAVYFITSLRLGVGAVTSLLALIAVGIGVGVAIVPMLARRIRHDRLIPLSFGVAAFALLGSGATLSRPTIVAGGMLTGLAYAMTKIPVDTIVQEEMPDSHRGRAFAAYDMLFNVARVGGTAATAVAVQAGAGPRGIIVTVGIAYLGASWLFLGIDKRVGSRLVAPPGITSDGPEASYTRNTHDTSADSVDHTHSESGPEPDPETELEPEPGPEPGPPTADESDALRSSWTLRPRRGRRPTPGRPSAAIVEAGELVAVRAYAGHRADAEPRAIVVGGREIPIEAIEWRALEERLDGTRRQIFVVRTAGSRLRLAVSDDSTLWEVERVLASNDFT